MKRQARATRVELVACVQQALILHQQGHLEEAGRLYDHALASDPHNFDALHLMGVLRHQQGCSDDALRFLAAALETQPGSADALTNYGVILDALKRHQEALSAFEKVAGDPPSGRHRLLQPRSSTEKSRPLPRRFEKL